ncbi:MAG: hypothetical protein ACYCXG_00700 [Acidiferrobacter sp.]
MRRYRRMTALIGFVIALLALPAFWLPNDVLTRHPGLQAFVLDAFGRLLPLIQVANTVSPHGQVMAVM